MEPTSLWRTGFFLAGLFTLLSWELAVPHHAPTAPRARRWLHNLLLAAINGGATSLLCLACLAVAAARAAPWRSGLFEVAPLPLPLRWVAEIALLDLLVWGLHRTYHAVPWLWRFHSVHHSDRDLDVTSASRFHLGEVLVSGAAKLAAFVLLGISALGLVAFEVVMLLCAQFQHANIRLPRRLEPALWWSFVPPAMHRIHHHPERSDTDSNYGTILTAWDRLFGTLRRRALDDHRFGIPGADSPPAGIGGLLALPFRRAHRG